MHGPMYIKLSKSGIANTRQYFLSQSLYLHTRHKDRKIARSHPHLELTIAALGTKAEDAHGLWSLTKAQRLFQLHEISSCNEILRTNISYTVALWSIGVQR